MNSLQNIFQFLTGFLAVIERKKVLILCFSEENTDSTLLLIPRGLMLEFQIKAFQSIDQPRSLIYDKFLFSQYFRTSVIKSLVVK